MTWRAAICLLLSFPAFAQDELRVLSPNGKIECRVYVATQIDRALSRLAYDVSVSGKPVIGQSYLGLDIWDQEPLLGENTGLISSSSFSGPLFRSLKSRYMQNGSLGRLLELEVRAYDDGVAFRYIIPRSILLQELLIAEEATEFNIVQPGAVKIAEEPAVGYPPMRLAKDDGTAEIVRVADGGKIAYKGTTPFTGPWRLIEIGPNSKLTDELKQ
jgi:hypothetical protein